MIIDEVNSADLASNLTEDDRKNMREGISAVSSTERAKQMGHSGQLFTIVGNDLAAQRECAYMLERRLFDTGYFAIVLDADALQLGGKERSAAYSTLASTLVEQGLIVICIDLYGEIKAENAFTIAIAEDSTQPVDRNKDICAINPQHIAATVEDIINIKL